MASAFGFVKYPQLPAPDPRKLGLALMQHAQAQQPMGEMEQEPDEPDFDQDDPMRPRPRWRF